MWDIIRNFAMWIGGLSTPTDKRYANRRFHFLMISRTKRLAIMAKKRIIKVGDRFGNLTIIKEVEPNITPCGTKQRKFLCKCECGNVIDRDYQAALNLKRYGEMDIRILR